MIIVDTVINIIHVIKTVLYYTVTLSYHIGHFVFRVLEGALALFGDLLTVIGIFCEEFYHFACDLNASIGAALDHLTQTTNNGVRSFIEANQIFCRSLAEFVLNTKLHTRLLTTYIGRSISQIFVVVLDAIILIGECCWGILMFIPRKVVSCCVSLADFIVFSIDATVNLLIWLINTIIKDTFNLTIGIAVLFLIIHWRKGLAVLLVQLGHKFWRMVQRFYIYVGKLLQLEFPDERHRKETNESIRYVEKLPDSHCCVICRERSKSVLLIPCRHLCFCVECSDYIDITTDPCPICRSNIRTLLDVYS